jgi:outer membrane immunogenic protein
MSMKNFFGFAVLALALSAGTARSADVMSDPAYDWTGFYSGVDLGYASAKGNYFADTVGDYDLKTSGARFGTLNGYNFQSDNIVFGIESDTSLGTLNDSNATIDEIKIGIESTLRARVGVSMNRLLPYVTAGAALAQASSNQFIWGKDKNFQLGFVAGAGLEYAATDHLRLRAEYLYENFGKETYHIGPFDDTINWHQQTLRVAAIWAW